MAPSCGYDLITAAHTPGAPIDSKTFLLLQLSCFSQQFCGQNSLLKHRAYHILGPRTSYMSCVELLEFPDPKYTNGITSYLIQNTPFQTPTDPNVNLHCFDPIQFFSGKFMHLCSFGVKFPVCLKMTNFWWYMHSWLMITKRAPVGSDKRTFDSSDASIKYQSSF